MHNERHSRPGQGVCLICGQHLWHDQRDRTVEIKQGRLKGKAHFSCTIQARKEQSKRLEQPKK